MKVFCGRKLKFTFTSALFFILKVEARDFFFFLFPWQTFCVLKVSVVEAAQVFNNSILSLYCNKWESFEAVILCSLEVDR